MLLAPKWMHPFYAPRGISLWEVKLYEKSQMQHLHPFVSQAWLHVNVMNSSKLQCISFKIYQF